MIKFRTGRIYDIEQVLEITIEQDKDDGLIREITATFVDASRHIEGRVHAVGSSIAGIGPIVLEAYDDGRYDPI
jgi:hypothetical protein